LLDKLNLYIAITKIMRLFKLVTKSSWRKL